LKGGKMDQFRSSIIFTIISMILAGGWAFFETGSLAGVGSALLIVVILGVLEVSLSFDNAVVNASVLETMDPVWQKRFLTWGMLIAVFGMRIVFPVVIVSIIAWIDPVSVIKIALTNPDKYAEYLTSSHTAISAFGGMFLLMVFLKFIFDAEKETHWIAPIVFFKTRKVRRV
jgi:uncharacterized protein